MWGVGQTVTEAVERSMGPQRPDRRRHVGAGARAIVNWRDRPVRLVVRRQRAPLVSVLAGVVYPSLDRRAVSDASRPELARPVLRHSYRFLARPWLCDRRLSPPASHCGLNWLCCRDPCYRGVCTFLPEPWSQSVRASANRAVKRRSLKLQQHGSRLVMNLDADGIAKSRALAYRVTMLNTVVIAAASASALEHSPLCEELPLATTR